MLTRKKKVKISKLLAAIIYIAENEPKIAPESFEKIVENAFNVSYEAGGFPVMNTTMKCVQELRKIKKGEIHNG